MRPARVVRRVIGEILPRLGVRRRRDFGDLEVAYTTGRGFGVFARRAFSQGEPILAVTGTPVRARAEFTIQVGPDEHLEPEAPLRFANHCCDPNAGFRVGADLRPMLCARRPIAVGDEITWDYATAESDLTVRGVPSAFRCRCGAVDCRGRIAEGWRGLTAEQQHRYAEWAMPYLRHRAS